ncbi:MAG: hypothetical protein M3Y77_08480 [Actinomycetota bacterium]|nr:hypothetical protein [Actinomycetota bacterium]MDQ2957837.1 hypothetical protein [Actinomycetota bacterium]
MNHTRQTVVGAAALLAAGIVGVGAASSAGAQPQSNAERITSVQQLRVSIQQAATVAKQETGQLSCCPAGQASAVHVHTPQCAADQPYREEVRVD